MENCRRFFFFFLNDMTKIRAELVLIFVEKSARDRVKEYANICV